MKQYLLFCFFILISFSTVYSFDGNAHFGIKNTSQSPSPNSVINNIFFTITDVSCSGGNNGQIVIDSISGGTPPFTYLWSTTATDNLITNLSAGTYSVTVYDSQGDSIDQAFSVDQPNPINVTDTITNVSCNGDLTGAIDITVAGGSTPYSYSWNNFFATTEDISGVAAGNYNLVLTDANNCNANISYTITEPDPLIMPNSVTDILCYGDSTGAINITVSGGVAPYTYNWSNSETTEDISGLGAGTYSVTVTDANNCNLLASYAVTEPSALVVSGVVTNVLCNGNSTGAINLTVSGGVAPYTYSWSNSATIQDISGLQAGTYQVTVTDANLCTFINTYTLTEPLSATSVSVTLTHVQCYGDSTGAINITVSGGVAPYTYAWSNGGITQDLSGLEATTYWVTITDANTCPFVWNYTINQPSEIVVTETLSHVLCNGDTTGNINITISGGAPPYINLDWSNGSTTQDISGITAGNYTVTFTDSNGCIKAESYTISEPPVLVVSGDATDVLCYGNNTGSIDLTVIGGTQAYSYTWSNSGTTQDISDLLADDYFVTVTDANTCTKTSSFTVSEPPELVITSLIIDVDCNGNSTGEIDITPGGGTPSYDYLWSGGETTQDLSGLAAGNYSITVTDDHSCKKIETYTVDEPQPLDSLETYTWLKPPSACGASDGEIHVNITGGTPSYSFSWSNAGNDSLITMLNEGIYYVTVTDANSCELILEFVLADPDKPQIEFSDSIKPCYMDANGELMVNILADTTYSVEWSNGATTQNLTGIPQGIYSITVTDVLNCITIEQISIEQHPYPVVALNIGDTSVCEADEIEFSEIGGAADAWDWSGPGITTPINNDEVTLSNIQTGFHGEYTCTIQEVYDDNSCPAEASFFLTVNPLPIVPVIQGDLELCTGEFPAYYEVPDPVAGMAYHWSLNAGQVSSWADSSLTIIAWNAVPGEYALSLRITDKASGCMITDETYVHISDNVSPEPANIVHMPWPEYDLLICDDVSEGISYKWGYDKLPNREEAIIEGETGQYCYLTDFNPVENAYWVETYFVYSKGGDTCTYRSYFNGSPYQINESDFEKFNFNLFPNPVNNDKLYVAFQNKNANAIGVRVFDLYGRQILQTKGFRTLNIIDVSVLSPGVYTCTIEFEGKIFMTRKFIVN